MRFATIIVPALASLALGAGSAVGSSTPAAGSSPMRWTTLGTNSGPIPNAERAEPANLLRTGTQNILVDSGDGAAWQAAKAGVSLRQINTIFISHLHFDHTGGLFAVLSQRYQMIEPSPLTIYGPPGTKGLVESMVNGMLASALGANNMRGFLRGKPGDNIKVVEMMDGQKVSVGNLTVTAVRNTHYIATPGGDDPSALSFAYRFDGPGRSIVYTGDTGPSAAVEALAKNADLLVCEIMDPDIAFARVSAATPNLPAQISDSIVTHFRREHVSPTEAGLMASRAGVKALVLTHNALPDSAIAKARAQIRANFKGPITFAKDLQTF